MEKFRYEEKGYNREDVNNFVTYVIGEMESLIDKIKEQRSEMNSLREVLSNYEKSELEFEKSYEKLESIGQTIRDNAKNESYLIIDQAKEYASKIINDALIRAEQIELDKQKIEKKVSLFKKQLQSIVEQQQTAIDELEDMKFDEQ